MNQNSYYSWCFSVDLFIFLTTVFTVYNNYCKKEFREKHEFKTGISTQVC